MASALQVTIPNTTIAQQPKPHTLYTVSIQLPLTSQTLQKRYSDFVALDASLRAQTQGAAPPPALPPKHLFKSTVNNPALTESRRRGLESYLQIILEGVDATYRNSPVLRAFLNLPASASASVSGGSSRASVRRGLEDQVRDAGVWLDVQRDLKGQLREVRRLIAERERAEIPGIVHSKSGEARGLLQEARRKASILDNVIGELGVGDGEVRRRRDLVRGLGKEIDALERDLETPVKKMNNDSEESATAAPALESGRGGEKKALFSGRGRVLGGPAKETEKTQSLDNEGVLQLQKQIMEDQDMDAGELTKNVRRLKEMGIQINEELDLQTQMLDLVDQDVDRLGGKIGIAKKRIGKLK